MIVPRQKLIWLAALAGVPLFVLLGFGGIPTAMAAPGLLVLSGIALADAQLSRNLLRPLSLILRARTNLFKGRAGEIEVSLETEQELRRPVRIGLNLPPALVCEREDIWVEIPRGARHSVLNWHCTPVERGRYQIPSAHLEIPSRLGLWSVRKAQNLNAEVCVYPDLFAERKRVAMVFFRRHAIGLHAQRQVGKGRDFEKLRDYIHGDPIEDVHWKATAKRGRPVTKLFQIERTQEVYVAIDCSRLSARRSFDPDAPQTDILTTVLDRFLTAALLLALATEQQGDHFGLVTFSDKLHQLIRAKSGHSHFALCRDALFELQPRLVTPDFDELCSSIRVRLRKRALVILLTALDDPLVAENFLRGIDLVSRQHLILVNMIEPGEALPVFDHRAPAVQNSSSIYKSLAGHMAWQKLRELGRTLESRGVKLSVLRDEMLARELVGQYLEVKQRQIL